MPSTLQKKAPARKFQAKPLGRTVSESSSALFDAYVLRPYNPDSLVRLKGGLEIYDEMRGDDQIKAVLGIKKHACLGSGWEIGSPEDNQEVADFIEENLRESLNCAFDDFLFDLLSALDYGFAVSEKVLKVVDGRYEFSSFKSRAPHTFTFYTDEFGNIEEGGFRQDTLHGEIKLDPSKFVHFVYQKQFDNWYGESDLRPCYRAWWSKNCIVKFWNMFLERFGAPTVLGKYDPSTTSVDLVSEFKDILKNIQSRTSLTFPNDMEIGLLEATRRGPADYREAISAYNLMIARAILVPDLLGFSKDIEGGSYSLGQKHFDIFLMVLERIRRQLEQAVKQDVIKYLVDLNFGEQDEYPEFKFKPLTEQNRQELAKLWLDAVKFGVFAPSKKELSYFREVTGFPEEETSAGLPKETPKEPPPEAPKEFALSREPNALEKKVDFEKVDEETIDMAIDATVSIGGVLSGLLENLKDEIVEREIVPKRNLEAVSSLSLKNLNQLKTVVRRHIMDAYKSGIEEGKAEMAGVKEFQIDPGYLEKGQVRVYFDEKSFYVVNAMRDDLNKLVRGQVLDAIKRGASTRDIIRDIGAEAEKYIPDREYARNRRNWIAGDIERKVNKGARLEAIVRTNLMEAYNEGRMQSFESPAVKEMIEGYQFSAVIDDRTSDICRELDGTVFSLDNFSDHKPPLHFSCRSMLIPVTKFEDYTLTPKEEIPAIEKSGAGWKLKE